MAHPYRHLVGLATGTCLMGIDQILFLHFNLYVMIMKKSLMACALVAFLFSCDKDDDENLPSNNISTADRNFVQQAAMGNQAELETSQLALTRGDDTAIRSFAQMMITDHQMAGSRLDSIATSLGLSTPDSLDAEHVALKAQLDTLSGRAFDSVYINTQVSDHQENITLFQGQRDNGTNQRLKDFAGSVLPSLQMHLQLADSISNRY